MSEQLSFDLGPGWRIDSTHYAFEDLKDMFWPTEYSSGMSQTQLIQFHNRQVERAFQVGRAYADRWYMQQIKEALG